MVDVWNTDILISFTIWRFHQGKTILPQVFRKFYLGLSAQYGCYDITMLASSCPIDGLPPPAAPRQTPERMTRFLMRAYWWGDTNTKHVLTCWHIIMTNFHFILQSGKAPHPYFFIFFCGKETTVQEKQVNQTLLAESMRQQYTSNLWTVAKTQASFGWDSHLRNPQLCVSHP